MTFFIVVIIIVFLILLMSTTGSDNYDATTDFAIAVVFELTDEL